MIWEK